MRSALVVVHRYAGLTLAAFLILVGITGSLLAFYHELDAALNPHLYKVPPPEADSLPLDPFTLRERAERLVPGSRADFVDLRPNPGAAQVFYLRGAVDPLTGKPAELADDQLFLNPYTGEEVGRRKWGDITQGLVNVMPFLYRLHYTLAIPGRAGVWILGIIALIWTIDCFVGFYLTLPARRDSGREGRTFWRRWKAAWLVKWRAGAYRVNFDLHRASGLWLWALLLVFAWSGVGLNLPQVYKATMQAFLEFRDPYVELPNLKTPQHQPAIGWTEAYRIARQHMAQHSDIHGFKVVFEDSLSYDAGRGLYRYRVNSDRDVYDRRGSTILFLDANSGEIRYLSLPTGQASGNTVTVWLYALHFGWVFGLPYRILVCVAGVVVAILSLTGVVIWMCKRRAKAFQRGRQAAAGVSGLSNSA